MMRFSPSTLSLLFECERCFWLTHRAGITRPHGMFSSLPAAIDRLIQADTASYAGTGKPKWLLSDSAGIIHAGPKKLFLKTPEFTLSGRIDDLLVEDGSFSIIDYKTSSRVPSLETAKRFYGLQMDCYAYLCEGNGYKPLKCAYLVFFTPTDFEELVGPQSFRKLSFKVSNLELPVDSQSAIETLSKAIEVCNLPAPPPASRDCEFCLWRESIRDLFLKAEETEITELTAEEIELPGTAFVGRADE